MKINRDLFCILLKLHYFELRSKIGCTSEKPKNIWFFVRFALSLHPESVHPLGDEKGIGWESRTVPLL